MARKLIKKEIGPIRNNMIYQVPLEIVAEFAVDCLSCSNFTKIDTLDCSKSFMRERSDLTLNQAFEIINKAKDRWFSFILRKGYHSQFGGKDTKYWEFCASGSEKTDTFEAVERVEHFVWIEIKEEDGNRLIEKYKLIKNDGL